MKQGSKNLNIAQFPGFKTFIYLEKEGLCNFSVFLF